MIARLRDRTRLRRGAGHRHRLRPGSRCDRAGAGGGGGRPYPGAGRPARFPHPGARPAAPRAAAAASARGRAPRSAEEPARRGRPPLAGRVAPRLRDAVAADRRDPAHALRDRRATAATCWSTGMYASFVGVPASRLIGKRPVEAHGGPLARILMESDERLLTGKAGAELGRGGDRRSRRQPLRAADHQGAVPRRGRRGGDGGHRLCRHHRAQAHRARPDRRPRNRPSWRTAARPSSSPI